MRTPTRLRRRTVVSLLVLGLSFAAGAVVAAPPNDPGWAGQWAPARIGAPTAWDTSRGTGITIGVVDTGVDLNHEDLGAKVVASTACQATDGDPAACTGSAEDDESVGHGTHVAAIAAAVTDNSRGVAGMAPNARLVVAKAIFGQTGGPAQGTVGDINAGIRWVVDRGARVVNLSLGGNFLLAATPGTTLRDGIDYAWSKGAVVVLAAGNSRALGFGSAEYGDVPAIVVAATGPDDEISPESSPTGTARWAIAAPGGNSNNTNPRYANDRDRQILSAFPGDQYALMEGTSMAAPHVAGTAALVLSRPGVTAQRTVEILLSTANRSVGCGEGSASCAGRVDAAAAVAATTRPSGATTTTTVNTTTTSEPARTTTVPSSSGGPSTTVILPELTSTTVPEISVPEPTDRETTTTGDIDEQAAPPGGGRTGTGPLAVVGGLALVGAGLWAAAVARREGLPDLAVLPFVGRPEAAVPLDAVDAPDAAIDGAGPGGPPAGPGS